MQKIKRRNSYFPHPTLASLAILLSVGSLPGRAMNVDVPESKRSQSAQQEDDSAAAVPQAPKVLWSEWQERGLRNHLQGEAQEKLISILAQKNGVYDNLLHSRTEQLKYLGRPEHLQKEVGNPETTWIPRFLATQEEISLEQKSGADLIEEIIVASRKVAFLSAEIYDLASQKPIEVHLTNESFAKDFKGADEKSDEEIKTSAVQESDCVILDFPDDVRKSIFKVILPGAEKYSCLVSGTGSLSFSPGTHIEGVDQVDASKLTKHRQSIERMLRGEFVMPSFDRGDHEGRKKSSLFFQKWTTSVKGVPGRPMLTSLMILD